MSKRAAAVAMATFLLLTTVSRAAPGPNSIAGTVSGASGPEAGVWVIAETAELGNRLIKIVVTDERGRFLLPDLPKAQYDVWVRGYGVADSNPVRSSPGQTLTLKVSPLQDAIQAAQIYPANHWFSLVQPPRASEFPGTGPNGNGISPAMTTQQHWMVHMVEDCQMCHQMGTPATRNLPMSDDPIAAWAQRTMKDRSPDDPFLEDNPIYQKRNFGSRMSNMMTQFGRHRGLAMFADWTTRIERGETPPAPERPKGVERNVVLTIRDMAGGRFLHDSSSSDKRNPTVNANGPIYGYATYSGMLIALDPKTGREEQFKLSDAKGNWFVNGFPHTGALDAKGRVWMTNIVHFGAASRDAAGEPPAYCADPKNRFAQYFPRDDQHSRLASMFDPQTRTSRVFPLCSGTHHLNFDANERLYFGGDTEVVGWFDVQTWDRTKNVEQAVGWCPFVLDTNGDGKITPDRRQWNEQLAGIGGSELAGSAGADFLSGGNAAPMDPRKDTRIAGFTYGLGISPKDQSYWAAKYSPQVPSGILRVETGNDPPRTCKTEYYEPPKINGEYRAYNIRGVDVDADGIAWVAFGTGGAIGRFDRAKCKVLNGPTATGQHCPEGWQIIETPGPKFKATNAGSDWLYLTTIDHHDVFGLGKGVLLFPNSTGDELLAYLPKEQQFVHLRVPYPLGFYPRLVDGRIDDPKAGWKGRGLWATNNVTAVWHQEGGEGSNLYAVHFQLRPHPLAE